MRFAALSAKPFHHDEGVNGFFLQRLVEQGEYSYDPANYHGPTLYFLSVPFARVFGLEDSSVRALTALAGLLTVALALSLRGLLGRRGALAAGALLAVSNCSVYFSRYYIHESLVVLFGLATAASALRFLRTGQDRFLILSAASLGLLLATKETAVVHVGVALIAGAMAMLARPGWPLPRPRLALLGWASFGMLSVMAAFYSSFGKDPEAIQRAGSALQIWARTGREAHVNPWSQHLLWLWEGDPATLVMGTGGLLLVLVPAVLALPDRWRGRVNQTRLGAIEPAAAERVEANLGETRPAYALSLGIDPGKTRSAEVAQRVAGSAEVARGGVGLADADRSEIGPGLIDTAPGRSAFPSRGAVALALGTLGLLAAYSIVRYKTPWLALNVALPACLLGGIAFERMWLRRRDVASLILGAALIWSSFVTWEQSFLRAADETLPWPYAHTHASYPTLVEAIESFASSTGLGPGQAIAVTSPDYWPLPWSLRSYRAVGYWGKIPETVSAGLVIASPAQLSELKTVYGLRIHELSRHDLRPGVVLLLLRLDPS